MVGWMIKRVGNKRIVIRTPRYIDMFTAWKGLRDMHLPNEEKRKKDKQSTLLCPPDKARILLVRQIRIGAIPARK